jgi:hypothetical protein
MKLKNMIEEIKLYLFILSIIFLSKFIFEAIIKLFLLETPNPMKISKVNENVIYFALSYIITYIII